MKHIIKESNVPTIDFLVHKRCICRCNGTTVVYIFNLMYTAITSAILNNVYLPVFIFPVLGSLVVGSVIYRIELKSMGEGLPSYRNRILILLIYKYQS